MNEIIQLIPRDKAFLNYGLIYLSIEREGKIIVSRFISRLHRLLSDFIVISRGKIQIKQTLKGILRSENSILSTEIKLEDVWKALILISNCNLEDIILKYLEEIWNHILFPLWKEKKLLSPRIKSTSDPSELLIEFTSSETMETENSKKNELYFFLLLIYFSFISSSSLLPPSLLLLSLVIV